jgi:hypothetical protein
MNIIKRFINMIRRFISRIISRVINRIKKFWYAFYEWVTGIESNPKENPED